MKIKILICFFFIFSIHTIVWDPIYKYNIMKELFPNMDYYAFSLLYWECQKQKADINEIMPIPQKETNWINTSRNGHDWSVYQINEYQIWQRGQRCEQYMDLKIATPVAVSIWLSAKKKAKGNMRNALAYYNAGENYNLNNYTHWNDYVEPIMKDYDKVCAVDNKAILIK